MTSLNVLFGCSLLAVALAVPTPALAQVTADDFLPPVQGGPTDVKNPAKVKIEGKVVAAANAQDAINAAEKKNMEDLKGGNTPEVGATMVKFPSGLGFVATGVSAYRTMENPTATRIAKRAAYVIAFTVAKKELAAALGGLTNEGKETIRQAMTNVVLPKEEATNIATHSEESVQQAVDMMLRGFVVYEVKDDTKQNMVYVTIVTTPRTRGKLARPAPNAVEVDDLREGIAQILSEVKAGLVPPVGGRIIMMRTGETAFVGFGSVVVRSSENSAVQAKLNLDSQKIAKMRAADALCGLIIGDKTSWQGGVTEKMHDEVKEFDDAAKGDPTAGGEAGLKKLEKAKQTFMAKMESTDEYKSARSGVLPAGIVSKTWFDGDHAWAYGMAVYIPSMTNAARGAAEDMRNAKILDGADNSGGKKPDDGSSGFTDENNPNIKKPSTTSQPGPSGKVGEDKEL